MGGVLLKPIIDRALFPKPVPPRYKPHLQNLIWIPAGDATIPCLFFSQPLATHLFLYSHGNASDLGTIYYESQKLSNFLNVHFIAVEYCGYGLYPGEPSEEKINVGLEKVLRYAITELKIPPNRIVLFGRSLGTGPSSRLAAKLEEQLIKIGGVILQSPFTSIFEAAKNLSFAASLFMSDEVWQNIREVKAISTPLLLLHGKQDKVIPHCMSTQLYHACPSKHKRLKLSDSANHNRFELFHDLIKPISKFLTDFVESKDTRMPIRIIIPKLLRRVPSGVFQVHHKSSRQSSSDGPPPLVIDLSEDTEVQEGKEIESLEHSSKEEGKVETLVRAITLNVLGVVFVCVCLCVCVCVCVCVEI
ncbi:hypothetical protein AAMO2058_000943900 [Amorphochlora amoebiformis]